MVPSSDKAARIRHQTEPKGPGQDERLAYKAKDNAIVVLEDINMDTLKTAAFTGILSNPNIAEKSLGGDARVQRQPVPEPSQRACCERHPVERPEYIRYPGRECAGTYRKRRPDFHRRSS